MCATPGCVNHASLDRVGAPHFAVERQRHGAEADRCNRAAGCKQAGDMLLANVCWQVANEYGARKLVCLLLFGWTRCGGGGAVIRICILGSLALFA